MPKVKEAKKEFNEISDLGSITIVHPKTEESMAEITGYDLDVKFNMNLINTTEDVDSVIEGIGAAFKDMLINKLIPKG